MAYCKKFVHLMVMFSSAEPLIECVPNFSEGRNHAVIDAIADAIRQVPDVKLLHIDMGYDANRTVYTFAGKPAAVAEAAFQAVLTAAKLIDMRQHHGEHPRMGACDVCPFIPVQHISMEEVIALSKSVGRRIGEQGIPVFLYEFSATSSERQNLAYLRKGEYEGINDKIMQPEWQPDFGPQLFHPTFGMMALGARKFLIAYNVNLDTKDLQLAKNIAREIREMRMQSGNSKAHRTLQHVKAIGWWMEAYNCTQISTNITDIFESPIVEVFDIIRATADRFGVAVAGSELIGLIPEAALKHDRMSPQEVVSYLGLDSLKPFDLQERILERLLVKV